VKAVPYFSRGRNYRNNRFLSTKKKLPRGATAFPADPFCRRLGEDQFGCKDIKGEDGERRDEIRFAFYLGDVLEVVAAVVSN
jgi:hypothetical protein